MIGRRGFLALASGLLVPRVAYSFAGGWALPAAFVEYEDGRILELRRAGTFTMAAPAWYKHPPFPAFQSTGIYEPADPVHVAPFAGVARIVVPEAVCYFEQGRPTRSTLRPDELSPVVNFGRMVLDDGGTMRIGRLLEGRP